jgi:hypothetical protein
MADKKTKATIPGFADSALTAILAAILWPEDFRNGRKAEAIRRAHRLIKSVPDYLGGKDPSLKQSLRDFGPEIEQRTKEASEWGLSEPRSYLFDEANPDMALSFEAAITQGICAEHKTVNGLKEFLQSVGYPKHLLDDRVITKAGYDRAIEKRQHRRRTADRERKRKKRSQSAMSKMRVKPT